MLRNVNALYGYSVRASDGEVGEIEDLLFDNVSWAVRYLVVNASNWLATREALVLLDEGVVPDPETEALLVNVTRQQLQDSPLPPAEQLLSRHQKTDEARLEINSNLRSVKEVTGFHIQARDGEVGHVEDFIVDTEQWMLRYIVVDTRNWLPGKKVLVAPTWVETIDWNVRRVNVDLKRQTIKNSPEYDPSQSLDREYETDLHDYYDQPRYWTGM